MLKRTITGVLLAIFVLAAVWLQGYFVVVPMTVATLVCIHEMLDCLKKAGKKPVEWASYLYALSMGVAQMIVTAQGGNMMQSLMVVQLVLAPNLPRWMGTAPDVRPHAVTYFRIIGANYLLHTGMLMATNILRCMGDTKTPLKFNIATNLINVCGNFLLIYPTRQLTVFDVTFTMPGAGMGVAGAALATVSATAFSAICPTRSCSPNAS